MHPTLFHIGNFPMGTYGLLLAIAFFVGTWLAQRQGRLDQISAENITNLTVAMLFAAVIGSKLGLIVVEMSNGRMGFADIFTLSTMRAGGVIHTGVLAATLVFFWMTRPSKGLPMRPLGDAIAPGVAIGQAIGRLGCFAAGCCYGTFCEAPWAVTFTSQEAHDFSGTPLGLHLHPVQLYTSASNLLILGLLLLARRHRKFQGQILSLYFILEGTARIIVETWRGDLDRGTWFNLSWLSTGRLTAMGFILIGAVLWAWWSRTAQAGKTDKTTKATS